MPHKDPLARLAYSKARYQKIKDDPEEKAKKAAYRAANHDRVVRKVRECSTISRYGITLERVEQMKQEQDGQCSICGERPKRLCVDHNHETGRVREMLCIQCNVKLGALENAGWYDKAQAYLRKHQG